MKYDLLLLVILICGSVMLGAIFGKIIITDQQHSEAIDHNCAIYNAKTGDFEWIGNE